MKLLLILLSSVIVLFSACTNDPAPKAELPFNFICLVDFSGSIDRQTIDWYRSTIENELLLKLSNYDLITVLAVDRGSVSAAKEILYEDLYEIHKTIKVSAPNLMQEAKLKKEAFEKAVKIKLTGKLAAGFNHCMERKSLADGTDIIGGIRLATKYFRKDARNVVVIFSDMIQFSDDLKMSPKGKAAEYLKISQGLSVPALANTEFLVLTGEQPLISLNEYNQIKEFWTAYLQDQNRADLIGFGSAELVDLRKFLAQ